MMKVLNFVAGFSWASSVDSSGYAKICISMETFWISNCQETSMDGQVRFKGMIANELLDEDLGLKYGDEVCFVPTLMD